MQAIHPRDCGEVESPALHDLAGALRTLRLPVSHEKKMQEALAEAFDAHGIEYRREVRLGHGDIVDFMVGETALELKIRGQVVEIHRQCERYLAYEEVTGLILMTARPMAMPTKISGKPVIAISAGAAWL